MESPHNSPAKPLRSASLNPGPPPSDDADSGVFELTEQAVLVLMQPGPDLATLLACLEAEGLALLPLSDATAAEVNGAVPRLVVIDASLPGALDWLRRVNAQGGTPHAIVTLAPGERESDALAAGASVTLQRPLAATDVVLCLRRFRAQQEQAHQCDGFDRPSVSLPLLESVLSTIGHETRNLLAAALANVECLRDGGELRLGEEDRKSSLDDTALALRRIQDMMSAVSALVKGAPPVLERVDLWSVAERALASVRPGDTRLEIAGERAIRGWGNSPLLEQVVANLVQNALDATQGQERRHVLVRVYATSSEARISVRDNGPGVPAALRQRIFEPFFSTKAERGTGLGLVLVRHAVARMGGTLSLGPSEHGAVFRVRLRQT